MADDDEIDILGDFSFNSCLAQNNQGIPSCSDREDTVHPQWLLDSVSANWYDIQTKDRNRKRDGPSRKLTGNNSKEKYFSEAHTMWSHTERDLLIKEMGKYGRNIRKISQTIKTKTEAEIQALIEAEYGVNLDTPSFGLEKNEDHEDIPSVVQEEIVTDDIPNILNIVSTGSPTISVPKRPFRRKNYNKKSKNTLLKPDALIDNTKIGLLTVNPSEILYEDDLTIGSTESIGTDMDTMDIVSRNILIKQQKEKIKALKKIGNHRRKVSRNYDRGNSRNRSKDPKSPQGRQRKDSSLTEDSTKSTKLQIVLGSGVALPVSEGEQVIKIEKKNDSEPESDIEIDVDSDGEDSKSKKETEQKVKTVAEVASIAVPLRKFEKMPRRQKKINLDGGGGYTIMHTAAGDLYSVSTEPRRERQPRRPPVQLIQCRLYNAERPAPYEVRIHVSALISMDVHAHTSRGEVMGLAGGVLGPRARELLVQAYRPAAAAAARTHCDMDPVSQALAAESLRALGLSVCAWHHSHPSFPPAPSALDLRTQRALQLALEWASVPLLGIITSQHWPTGRVASQYRCIRVEDPDLDVETPVGYQLSARLVADLTAESVPRLLAELRGVLLAEPSAEHAVRMRTDLCPQARLTYLDKCLSSISHHLRSAGYDDDDPVVRQLLQGVRDVVR